MEQLSEVYGIDTTAVKGLKKKFFIAESFVPQKIDLNKLNPEEMKHPYIRHKEAYAIIAYRKQHGDLESIDQLKEIKILSTEWIERIPSLCCSRTKELARHAATSIFWFDGPVAVVFTISVCNVSECWLRSRPNLSSSGDTRRRVIKPVILKIKKDPVNVNAPTIKSA